MTCRKQVHSTCRKQVQFPGHVNTANVPCVAAVEGSGASWLAVLCSSSAASSSSMMLLFSSSVAGDILLCAWWTPEDLGLPPDRPGLPPLTASLHHIALTGYLQNDDQMNGNGESSNGCLLNRQGCHMKALDARVQPGHLVFPLTPLSHLTGRRDDGPTQHRKDRRR